MRKSECMAKMHESAWKEITNFVVTQNDRVIVEELAVRVFGNPYTRLDEQGRPRINRIEEFAYLFIGPFVAGLMRWFLLHVQREHYDKILFSTRDGYLVQKLYHRLIEIYDLRDMPKDCYFPISRTLCAAAAVFVREDLLRFGKVGYAHGPEAMLTRRFGLKKEQIKPFEHDKFSNVEEYILAHEQQIMIRSKQIREHYLKYMRGIGLKEGEHYALFDFVSSGTCQLLLKYICNLSISGVYAGRYFPFKGITNYTSEQDKYRLPIHAYVVNQSTIERETNFFADYNFLELIFTSKDPSIASMDQHGPVFDQELRSMKELEHIDKMQTAIFSYMEDISKKLILDEEISFPLVDFIFGLKNAKYTREECSCLDQCELVEDFGQGRIQLKRRSYGTGVF
ncbi:MAG: hypothetical protein HFH34_11185 [Eubacterium sp.]|nr:hypothetical protein [Eubacterium sp.]